jgi:hypothetical protein
MKPIHDRMPVILDPADWDSWLNPDTDPADLEKLLVPAPAKNLEAYPISPGSTKSATTVPSCSSHYPLHPLRLDPPRRLGGCQSKVTVGVEANHRSLQLSDAVIWPEQCGEHSTRSDEPLDDARTKDQGLVYHISCRFSIPSGLSGLTPSRQPWSSE